MNSFRRFFVLLLAVVAALVLVACAGSDNGSSGAGTAAASAGDGNRSQSASEILRKTFSASSRLDSGRFELGIDLDAPQLRASKIRVSGAFQGHGKTAVPDFTVDMNTAVSSVSMSFGITAVKGGLYMSMAGESFRLDEGSYDEFRKGFEQAAASASGSGSSMASLGIDPRSWLRGARIVGEEEVAAVDTTHIVAAVKPQAMIEDLQTLMSTVGGVAEASGNQAASDELLDLARSLRDVKVDVFTGKKDQMLRRMVLSFKAPAGDSSAGSLAGLRIDLRFTELNEPQTITAPKNPRSFKQLQTAMKQLLQLGEDLGGAAGGALPDGSDASKYLDCVKSAGSDVDKIKDCVSLVGAQS